mmetsp:Transcript_109101/g.303415  ORF Transcript_109101/g.303415 Transcript_109101/m.303415 type:complete len:225 (-) Transcript_109101:88-762(-)
MCARCPGGDFVLDPPWHASSNAAALRKLRHRAVGILAFAQLLCRGRAGAKRLQPPELPLKPRDRPIQAVRPLHIGPVAVPDGVCIVVDPPTRPGVERHTPLPVAEVLLHASELRPGKVVLQVVHHPRIGDGNAGPPLLILGDVHTPVPVHDQLRPLVLRLASAASVEPPPDDEGPGPRRLQLGVEVLRSHAGAGRGKQLVEADDHGPPVPMPRVEHAPVERRLL